MNKKKQTSNTLSQTTIVTQTITLLNALPSHVALIATAASGGQITNTKPVLRSHAATTIVAKGIFSVLQNDGPNPIAGSFRNVRLNPETAANSDFDAVQLVSMKSFAAEDCGAVTPQLDRIWDVVLEELQAWWEGQTSLPFPTAPSQPNPFNCDTTISKFVTVLLIWSDNN